MKKAAVTFSLMLVAVCAAAQRNTAFSERIRSLEVTVDGDRTRPAVAKLGSESVEISFDDMTHDYVRYVYKLEHCDHNWQPSDGLFENNYMSGTNLDHPIDDYERSRSTSNLYTHYRLRLPNANVRPLLSGNYRVSIYDDSDTSTPLAVACFSLLESGKFTVAASATVDTDIDSRDSHQQLSLAVGMGNVEVRDPSREVFVTVLQNKRYDNAIHNPEPTFESSRELRWEHCRDLIFPAGGEFRKFEIINVHQSGLNVDRMRWFDPYYHAMLYAGKPMTNYIYSEEVNGSYVIRGDGDISPETECEYVVVHFTLQSPRIDGGDFYVCGWWNTFNFLPENRMHYDEDEGAYTCSLLLKQGYYNYQYLFLPDGERQASTAEAEGNFFQTENEYTVLVYAHLQGERYDRLLGYRDFRYLPDKQ